MRQTVSEGELWSESADVDIEATDAGTTQPQPQDPVNEPTGLRTSGLGAGLGERVG
jgi:hypothetical protein